uniref:Lysosomal proton-coupled steroid conjugate and bile acid symporter SLC46A3 n=1 Tax=Geotrypetes seraphini TaxID=260995 RepID=A0A6P8RA56_GEOSA|nr:solute carrier family 46 member 3-like [Geotrypetes seraphini]XP_033805553.1 solute carrier family 46 member 3-like [Geotrypetes seraphini]XP_033805554.1 solute carrier family 46 member 3-like [Geotrypetes seraphini]XP_033805555.1 solute carrier family 46 member 3-like [Geotrypetes seraphini]XP_033805556.1 solute carrier family 46 member 3-like [Geotrypetes seraphini]XP_033805557.1 solute carrier family 46 member 3-like [Geotrypetes seraphini]XP_033805558.1 solute carrier family 46 member 
MKKLLLVEPVVAIYSFASFMTYPLIQQYVYRSLWEEVNNSSFKNSLNISHCEINESNPIYIKQKEVQQRASLFSMSLDLSGLIPSLVVALILVAYGDHHGRKAAMLLPSIGSLVSSSFCFAMSYFSLTLYLFFASSLIGGFLGSFATFLGGCFSYVADLCHNEKQKTIRIALIDMILGLGGGLAGLSSGYFLRELGFTWSFVIISLLHFLNIGYIIFCLEDTVKVLDSEQKAFSIKVFKEIFCGVFLLFKTSSCRKRIVIILMLGTFMTYLFSNMGGVALFTLYELDAPLCWNEVLIGWGSSLSTLVFLSSFLGIYLFSCCLKDAYIVLIGIISWIGGIIMAAFATTTQTMFLVRLPLLFAAMPLPVLRSMMSKVVHDSEQGALFACIACLESLIGTVALIVFNSIYAATVTWYPGFCFLLAAGLSVIPFSIVCLLLCMGYQEKEHTILVNPEESMEDSVS